MLGFPASAPNQGSLGRFQSDGGHLKGRVREGARVDSAKGEPDQPSLAFGWETLICSKPARLEWWKLIQTWASLTSLEPFAFNPAHHEALASQGPFSIR